MNNKFRIGICCTGLLLSVFTSGLIMGLCQSKTFDIPFALAGGAVYLMIMSPFLYKWDKQSLINSKEK